MARSKQCAAAGVFDAELGPDCMDRPYRAHNSIHPGWRFDLVEGDDWNQKFEEARKQEPERRRLELEQQQRRLAQ